MSQSRVRVRVVWVGGGFRSLLSVIVAVGAVGAWASAARGAEGTAYVGNEGDGTVTPITLATNTPGPPILVDPSPGPTGPSPAAIAVTPDGRTAYVAVSGRSWVTPIDVVTNTPGTPIPVGATPVGIAITPDGRTAYVANEDDATVTPIDLTTHKPGTPITVGGVPAAVAISDDGQTAYVADSDNSQVVPIDTSTNTLGPPIPVGRSPFGIAISPNGQTAYVSNDLDATLTPIDTVTNTPGAAIPLPLENCTPGIWMALTPGGSTAYVTDACEGVVTPLDLATGTTGTSIPVTDADHIAISADGTTAYVTSPIQSDVIPITLATKRLGTAIAVGQAPVPIAITPGPRRPATTSVGCVPASIASGQPTHCTVTVTDTGPGATTTPQGRVSLVTDAPGTITGSPCLLSGSGAAATCRVTYVPVVGATAPATLTARFPGDYEHLAGSGDTVVAVTADRARTRTRMSCRPALITLGQSTTCTASVAARHRGVAAAPTGTVTFAADRPDAAFTNPCTLSEAGEGAICQITATPEVPGLIRIRPNSSTIEEAPTTRRSYACRMQAPTSRGRGRA
ncbi:MAG TPA: hypothetical protein VHW96_00235 [Solirubrobacteraceae bacterium]|nr:hypothetical protein [Solirubrobacteraceae bacterium]